MLLVVAIIALLATLTIPLFGVLRDKARAAVCMSNLRALHVSFNGYLQDHGNVWPQLPQGGFGNEEDQWRWWLDTLKDYGSERKHWLCPSDEDGVKAQNDTKEDHFIGSYVVCQFDEFPETAFRWAQPWIVERGGHGANKEPNMLMPDGSIVQGFAFSAPQ